MTLPRIMTETDRPAVIVLILSLSFFGSIGAGKWIEIQMTRHIQQILQEVK